MNLLLFLSAMLSALTGAISGVRFEQPLVHARADAMSGAQAAATARIAAPVRRSHPAPATPASITPAIARAASAIGWALAAPVPLYLGRLRE